MKIRSILAVLAVFVLPQFARAVDVNVTLSMPQNIIATAGQTVTIPINLSNIQSAITLDAFTLVVMYDNNFFDTPTTSGFSLGTLTTGLSYTGSDNVDAGTHTLNILRTNVSNPANLTTSSNGSIMTFDIHVKTTATPGTSGYLQFVPTQGASSTEILSLSADNVLFNPTLTDASNQGLVSILPVPEPSTYAMGFIAFGIIAGCARFRKKPAVQG